MKPLIFEVRVTYKDSGRTEPTRGFPTLAEAEKYASRWMPSKGTRPFRVEIQDMRTGVREPLMTGLPGFVLVTEPRRRFMLFE